MSATYQATIKELRRHIERLETEVADTKKTINSLCRVDHKPPIFTDAELSPASSTAGQLRGDEYYGKPLATVVRMILEARQANDLGPTSISEIYSAMVEGGYQFDAKNKENAQRGLRISIAKNAIFHKLPTGKIGLTAWYPGAKDAKAKTNGGSDVGTDEDAVTVGATSETKDDAGGGFAPPSTPK